MDMDKLRTELEALELRDFNVSRCTTITGAIYFVYKSKNIHELLIKCSGVHC